MGSNKAFHPYGAQGAPRVNADVRTMKIIITSFLVALTLSGCGVIERPPIDPWPGVAEDDSDWLASGSYCHFNDSTYMTRVTRGDARRTPDWNPNQQMCPVPMDEAVQMATLWAKKHVPNHDWHFHHLELRYIAGRKWHYFINLKELDDFDKDGADFCLVAVLLNRAIRGPETEIYRKNSETGKYDRMPRTDE